MKEVVHSVVEAVEPLAVEKGLGLQGRAAGAICRSRHGDERRIAQVLLNLVGNAIKFTDAGEVAIKASRREWIVHGRGVATPGRASSPADQARIFEEFQQADSSATKKKGGTGLGLSIAKRIVEMHGGRIWVESSLGQRLDVFLHASGQG